MANKRIIDLTTTTTPSGYVALDHETNGTKKLDVAKIAPVDSALSSSSTNAVQNKVINTALSGKLATNGNSQNNTVAFTSGDVANDAAATSWTANVATLATGLTHANLFNRISTMMKNVRYLYNAVTKLNTDLIKKSVILYNTDDLNNIIDPGFYYLNSGVKNSPKAWSWLIVLGGSTICQVVYNETETFLRARIGTPTTWTSWVKTPTRTEFSVLANEETMPESSITVADGWSLLRVSARKVGKIVTGYLFLKNESGSTPSAQTLACTFGTGYIPAIANIPTVFLSDEDWRPKHVGYGYIGTSGQMVASNPNNAANVPYVMVVLSYAIA